MSHKVVKFITTGDIVAQSQSAKRRIYTLEPVIEK